MLAAHVQAVRSDGPVLIERWRTADGRLLIHVVNYADRRNVTRVPLNACNVQVHSPDQTHFTVEPDAIVLDLDVYAVIEAEPRAES